MHLERITLPSGWDEEMEDSKQAIFWRSDV